MTYLGDDWEMQYHVKEMKAVLFKTIDTIIHLQKHVKHSLMEPSSLNICITDQLWFGPDMDHSYLLSRMIIPPLDTITC